jgi:hypothetical protein
LSTYGTIVRFRRRDPPQSLPHDDVRAETTDGSPDPREEMDSPLSRDRSDRGSSHRDRPVSVETPADCVHHPSVVLQGEDGCREHREYPGQTRGRADGDNRQRSWTSNKPAHGCGIPVTTRDAVMSEELTRAVMLYNELDRKDSQKLVNIKNEIMYI